MAELFNEGISDNFNKYVGTRVPMDKKSIRELRRRYSLRKKNEFVFIAVDTKARRVVGNCNFHAKDIHSRLRHRGEIGWFVKKEYARRGIGTMLLRTVLKEARKRGYKKVQAEAAVMNAATVRLDKRRGFRIE